MFIVTLILFLLPCSFLWAAWKRFDKHAIQATTAPWRKHCGKAALALAVCSTVLELVFFYSWFHNGGGIHGTMPAPGIWKFLGRIAFGVLLTSIVVSAFGKGRWRWLILGWASSLVFAAYAIFMLEMD